MYLILYPMDWNSGQNMSHREMTSFTLVLKDGEYSGNSANEQSLPWPSQTCSKFVTVYYTKLLAVTTELTT